MGEDLDGLSVVSRWRVDDVFGIRKGVFGAGFMLHRIAYLYHLFS